jgi:hypothetical protein
MGIARLLDEQQPDKMKPISALTESVNKNNDPKRVKAKQIFLGLPWGKLGVEIIDAHLARNQVARKTDNGAIQGVQSFRFEELLLFAQKQFALSRRSLRGLRSRTVGLGALSAIAGVRDQSLRQCPGMFGTRKTQAQQAGRP